MAENNTISAEVVESEELAARIMKAISGRAGVRINGQIVQMNSKKNRLYVGERSIPVCRLHAHLTQHEKDELNNLPRWDGSNEAEISSACLRLVEAAIDRYEGPAAGCEKLPSGDELTERLERFKLVQRCHCRECTRSHQD